MPSQRVCIAAGEPSSRHFAVTWHKGYVHTYGAPYSQELPMYVENNDNGPLIPLWQEDLVAVWGSLQDTEVAMGIDVQCD